MTASHGMPSVTALWKGALFGAIVDATMRAANPNPASTRQWIRNHYLVNGGDGREGIVTFAGGHWYLGAPVVGVFHNVHSKRISKYGTEWTLERFFLGCPEYERALADQAALPYLELEVRGELEHRVTAAFWGQGDRLIGADPWEVLLQNGVDLIDLELTVDDEYRVVAFKTDYGASGEQMRLAEALFHRKLERPPAVVQLTREDARALEAIATSDDGLKSATQLLSEIGIVVPGG